MKTELIEDLEAVLFDFEGTLVDFQWKLSEAVQETLEMLGAMGLPKDGIQSRKYSTLLPEALAKAVEAGLDPSLIKEKIGSIYDRYDEDALTRWTLRPGVKDFLEELRARGIHIALVSNIGRKTLFRALPKLGLDCFFEVALSRSDVPNLKPAPDGINLALERMGVRRERSLFVGDSLDDVNASRNAGLRVMIISDGENLKEDIMAVKPDLVIHGYGEALGGV